MSNLCHGLHLAKDAGLKLLLESPENVLLAFVKYPTCCSHSGCLPQVFLLTSIAYKVAQKSLLTTAAFFIITSAQAKAIAMSQNLPVLGGPAQCWVLGSSRKKVLFPGFCHTLKEETGASPLKQPCFFLESHTISLNQSSSFYL